MLQLLPNLLYKILQIGASTLVDMLFVIKFVKIINIFLDILITNYVSSPRKKENGNVNRHLRCPLKNYFMSHYYTLY